MMMNIYYSSNRNNIDDTNKLFYKVVIFPKFYKIYIIYRLNTRYNPSPLGSARALCQAQEGARQDTAGRLCHLHGHCGLRDAVQAQALRLMVLSCYTADGTAGSYLWHSVHAGSNCGKF